jgi:NADH-quinone oxidoreductase subunit D
MHRGFEKLSEYRDYRQIMALMNRHDWISAACNEVGVALLVEKMMGLEVPERAQWIRTIICEWNRILNHLVFVGSFPLELGALTPVFYAFREREEIQRLMEMATGQRLHHNFFRVGGLKEDVPAGFLALSRELVGRIRARIREYEDLLLGNEIFKARTKGIGVLSAEVALDHGVSGAILHATGCSEDARKTEPYLKYGEVDFDVPVGENGDAYDRFVVLVERIRASLRIIEQANDLVPAGPVNLRMPKVVKVPEGAAYIRTENPLGQLSYYCVSRGEKTPWRFKIRTPSFNNVSVLPHMLRGVLLPDLVAIMGSMLFVVGDVDR